MLLHFVLAAAGTWVARHYALRRRLLDQPGARRSHAVATPRGGGISIVVAVLLGCAWLGMQWPQHAVLLACFATGLVLVAGIGWVDDHRPLSPWLRLAVQALAALILAWAVHRSTGTTSPAVLAFVLVMVLVNVWNFMDGIDGLAASQAGIAAAGLALVPGTGPWGWLAAGLVAAICGFLPFNFPKARIFLGDVGSGALGYILAVLLLAAHIEGRSHWLLLLLPVSAFLVDAGFTLTMRMLRGERWWTPHVQHAYQCWARRQGGHVVVTLTYAVFSLMATILMMTALRWSQTTVIWACSAWYGFAILAWTRLRKDVRLDKEADQ
ncbi:MAG TPA: glycosyltransferase family 4 protein [Lysobacter sp.]